jgi:hypothetical protein
MCNLLCSRSYCNLIGQYEGNICCIAGQYGIFLIAMAIAEAMPFKAKWFGGLIIAAFSNDRAIRFEPHRLLFSPPFYFPQIDGHESYLFLHSF